MFKTLGGKKRPKMLKKRKTHGTFETFQPGSHQRVVETFQNNFLENADINASPRVYAYVLIKKDHEQFLERFEFVN